MNKERRLGRGLAALLGAPLHENGEGPAHDGGGVASSMGSPAGRAGVNSAEAESVAVPSPGERDELLHLSVYEIDNNPFQPRRDFSEPEIASLAESLKSHAMLQPILVRRVGSRYQLISGERRLRAAIQAGWSEVPARLREADDRLVAELAIVENLQREDLNSIEKALSFKRYIDQHNCTQDDLASRLKIDRSTIANLVRLLELPAEVQAAVRARGISAGHARALLPLGDEREQIEFCSRIRREGLSVRQTEQLVGEHLAEADAVAEKTGEASSRKSKKPKNEQVAALEREFRIALGTRVDIRLAGRGKGKVIIQFRNHEEFERLREMLAGPAVAPIESVRRAG